MKVLGVLVSEEIVEKEGGTRTNARRVVHCACIG